MGRKYAVLVALAFLNGACGAIAQYTVGFSQPEERTATRTRRVRVANLPPDAYVDRVEPDGTSVPLKGRIDHIEYEVHETIDVPTSRTPMYVGTALDLVGVAASGWLLAQSDEDTKLLAAYGFGYALSAFIADLAFSFYYSIDQQPVVVGYEPAESKPVTYVGYLGDQTRRATIDVAVADRVDIDFDAPPGPEDVAVGPTEPGGPRLAATLPGAPGGAVLLPRTKPPPKIEESWYGWQTLPIDILSVVGLVFGTLQEDYKLAAGFGALHLASVPLIHLAHGQPDKAGASLGLRLAGGFSMGLSGALVGVLISPFVLVYAEGLNFFDFVGEVALYSAGIGFVALSPLVAILDGAALAWEPDESQPSLEIVPAAGRTDDGRPTFGIAGRF